MSYIVYKHTSPSNKVYIGITSRSPSKRWQNGRGYITNEYFYRAIQKYGWENIKHEVLFEGLTQEEACAKEIALIAEYKSTDYHYGYNNSIGGNLGQAKSVDQYTINGEYIKTYLTIAEAEIENNINGISACCNGKILTAGGFIWRHHGDSFDKYFDRPMRINDDPNNIRSIQFVMNEDYIKPIIQYTKDGTFIQRYNSVYDIYASNVNSNNDDNSVRAEIIRCCNKFRKYIYGCVWRFEGDEFNLSDVKIIRPSLHKRIDQYDINGNYIKTWDSILEATNYYHLSNIASVLRGTRHVAGGYVWRYEGESFDKYDIQRKKRNIKRKYDNMPVYQYDLDGNFIRSYDTVYDIDKNKFDTWNVVKCLLGEIHYSNGYVFSFNPRREEEVA